MKVLILNGSPRADGNTTTALRELENVLKSEGLETEVVRVGGENIRGCVACGSCSQTGKCVFDDAVNKIAEKFEKADALVVASPVYYASANATLVAVLQRLFYSTHFSKTMKVGASVAIARRGGTETTFDELNKFFTISGMPVASSCYWNNVFGRAPGDASQDAEGLYVMRMLAHNISFLVKCINDGKEKYGLPEAEPNRPWTHFIR